MDVAQKIQQCKEAIQAGDNATVIKLVDAEQKLITLMKKDVRLKIILYFKSKLTLLHFAALYSRSELVLYLLQKKSNIFAQDSEGHTPLHCAVQAADAKSVQILLQNKADPNMQNKKGETALHIAAALELDEICALLIANGANANSIDTQV